MLSSVVRDSGLALQFGEGGTDAPLTVSAGAVRKQAQEITRSARREGVFTAAVDLDRLISSGTGR